MTTEVRVPGYVCRKDEGEPVWFADSLVAIKASAESTGGGLGLMHVHAPRGAGSPVHAHLGEDESWYVLDGELRFWLGDEEISAVAGDFVFGPRGVPHRFSVESDEAHFLMIVNPGGFEEFVRATGWPAAGPVLPHGELPMHPTSRIADAVKAHRLVIESS